MVAQVQGSYADVYSWDNLYLAYRLRQCRRKPGKRTSITSPARARPIRGTEQLTGPCRGRFHERITHYRQ